MKADDYNRLLSTRALRNWSVMRDVNTRVDAVTIDGELCFALVDRLANGTERSVRLFKEFEIAE